jgi:hypothetical protein
MNLEWTHEAYKFVMCCVQGKHVDKKFPKQVEHHATQNLELVHNNVCGSFKVRSLERAKYMGLTKISESNASIFSTII